jgi:molybdopterin-guanine dinucleotide biosynthesis protein MobB
MRKSKVFGVYGLSDSGKTKLLERIIAHFVEKGFKVATVKRTKKSISIDTKEKDTWRHHKSGADLVVFSSLRETDFLLYRKMNTAEIVRRISEFGDFDLILVEGADDPTIPKIRIGKVSERSNTIASYDGNIKEINTLIQKELMSKSSLPQLSLIVNGKNVPLTEFPKQIITQTVLGMLRSLKGVETIREVAIHLKQ